MKIPNVPIQGNTQGAYSQLVRDLTRAGVPSVTFGLGAPPSLTSESDIYFDTSVTPYQGYVQHLDTWHKF